MPSSPGPVGSTGMAFRMTIGRSRPWPGYPRHTGLVSASCTSNPRFRHRLSSDPASRLAPLLRRMVPVITVHRGLAPPECTLLLDTQDESACPTIWPDHSLKCRNSTSRLSAGSLRLAIRRFNPQESVPPGTILQTRVKRRVPMIVDAPCISPRQACTKL